ncbi:MAG: 1-acyl-sn-glycerol-3-phosphate acyltransferase [Dehalococcoidia bacterium]|nr:1-acyl-sn-glycerol-3-phosphate acyltransferase [Dehalococcoidia bacterium]
MTLAQRIVLAIIKLLLKPLLSWKVEGRENVPLDGSLIVAANHVHLIDPILLQLSFPRWLNFMAKQELFRYPLVGFAIRWSQAFSIRRQGTIGDKRETIKQAGDILRGGLVLGMFPEGKRNRNGKLLPGKSGVAVIASRTGTPLLPVGIIGTEKLKGIQWLWKRPRIIINIGHPFYPPSIETRLSRRQARLLTDFIMSKIAALLPTDNRGVYGD